MELDSRTFRLISAVLEPLPGYSQLAPSAKAARTRGALQGRQLPDQIRRIFRSTHTSPGRAKKLKRIGIRSSDTPNVSQPPQNPLEQFARTVGQQCDKTPLALARPQPNVRAGN